MKRVLRFRPSPATVVSVVALVVALGGAAYAAIPDSGGIVHACYQKSNGNLRAVESATDCRSNEGSLSLAGGRSTVGSELKSPVSKLSIGQTATLLDVNGMTFEHRCESKDPRGFGFSRVFVEGQSWPPNNAASNFGELARAELPGLSEIPSVVVGADGSVVHVRIATGSSILGTDCLAQMIAVP